MSLFHEFFGDPLKRAQQAKKKEQIPGAKAGRWDAVLNNCDLVMARDEIAAVHRQLNEEAKRKHSEYFWKNEYAIPWCAFRDDPNIETARAFLDAAPMALPYFESCSPGGIMYSTNRYFRERGVSPRDQLKQAQQAKKSKPISAGARAGDGKIHRSVARFDMNFQSDNDNWFRLLVRAMRFNLIWYVLLGIWIIFYFVVPNVASGFHDVSIVFHRFTWAIFFSPSAYFFFASVVASVFLPFQLLLMIPAFFDNTVPAYRRRYVWSLIMAIVIVISAILLQVIIWGSFPLPVDKDGYVHLRMIPFIPWPGSSLLQ